MKKHVLFQLIVLFSLMSSTLQAQVNDEKVKSEINQTLQLFNIAAKNSDTEQLLALFDDSVFGE